jgi:hypothetical protein
LSGRTPEAAEITRRLARLGALARLRRAERREGKVPMSPAAVSRRLRRQSDLRRLCLALAALAAGPHRDSL